MRPPLHRRVCPEPLSLFGHFQDLFLEARMIGLVAAVVGHEEDEHERAQQQEERVEQKRHHLEGRHREPELGAGGDGHRPAVPVYQPVQGDES